MKTKIIILFGLLLCQLNGYAQTPSLTGTWQIDWDKMYTAMSTAEQSRFNSLPEEARGRVTSSFSSRTYVFNTDGSLAISWQAGSGARSETGTWSLSGSSLTMTVNSVEKSFTVSGDTDTVTLAMSAVGTGALVSNLIMNKQ